MGTLPQNGWLETTARDQCIPYIIRLVRVSVISFSKTIVTTIMPANAEPAAAVPHRPSSRAFISGLCLGLLVAGGFFFGIIASALGFLNPFAGAATTRPLSQAKAATPVGYSKIWGRLFVNSVEELVTGGHQARVMEWLGGAVGFFLCVYCFSRPWTPG